MSAVYAYFDVQEFLRQDFAERKARNPRFSLRAMAKRLELNSGTLIRIINGKRKIGKKLIPRFTDYLGLKHKEARYFSNLVLFCQAKSQAQRAAAYRELITLRNGRARLMGADLHAFYDEWYYSAVRELLRFHRFSGDFHALAKLFRPAITVPEARRAVELLAGLGLIRKAGSGYMVQDSEITTGERWESAAIERFQQQTIAMALEALERFAKQDRDISTMTMCFSPEGLAKVRELLKQTREELARIEENDRGQNRVYQINLQAFPLSEPFQGAAK
jgi:uncharacterized protein (TIGR02147 family)